jgi:hypothetical protein
MFPLAGTRKSEVVPREADSSEKHDAITVKVEE